MSVANAKKTAILGRLLTMLVVAACGILQYNERSQGFPTRIWVSASVVYDVLTCAICWRLTIRGEDYIDKKQRSWFMARQFLLGLAFACTSMAIWSLEATNVLVLWRVVLSCKLMSEMVQFKTGRDWWDASLDYRRSAGEKP